MPSKSETSKPGRGECARQPTEVLPIKRPVAALAVVVAWRSVPLADVSDESVGPDCGRRLPGGSDTAARRRRQWEGRKPCEPRGRHARAASSSLVASMRRSNSASGCVPSTKRAISGAGGSAGRVAAEGGAERRGGVKDERRRSEAEPIR